MTTINKNDLAEITDFLNRNLEYDKVTPELVELKTFNDPHFEPELFLVEKNDKNEIISLMFGVAGNYNHKKVGWLKMFATDEKYRRQGIAKKNLIELENRFKVRQVEEIQTLGSIPNYFQPGIDPRYTESIVFLMNNGYEKTIERTHMETDVRNGDWNTSNEEKELLSQNIPIRCAEKNDEERIIHWLETNFAAWQYESGLVFKKEPPYRMFIAENNDGIIGFSCYSVTRDDWFGPIGVTKDYRRLGLGKVLLWKCLSEMKKMGLGKIVIPWTGSYGFYANSCDAYISRVFWVMSKKL